MSAPGLHEEAGRRIRAMHLFESKLGLAVRLTEERWMHVCNHHPEMAPPGTLDRVRETVETPDHVVRSRTDPAVALFYRHYERTPVTSKHLCVVARTGADSPFVITAYYTDALKQGERLWSAK